MLSASMEKALNDQINAEGMSAYFYLSIAGYFVSIDLPGFAHWMRIQAQEELTHMVKFVDYVHARGGRLRLDAVDAPPSSWEGPAQAFQAVYNHEGNISNRINILVDIALAEKDHATNSLLQWFVAEQIEEMATVDEIIKKLKLLGGSGQGLFMLDRDLATRTLTPAPPA